MHVNVERTKSLVDSISLVANLIVNSHDYEKIMQYFDGRQLKTLQRRHLFTIHTYLYRRIVLILTNIKH